MIFCTALLVSLESKIPIVANDCFSKLLKCTLLTLSSSLSDWLTDFLKKRFLIEGGELLSVASLIGLSSNRVETGDTSSRNCSERLTRRFGVFSFFSFLRTDIYEQGLLIHTLLTILL